MVEALLYKKLFLYLIPFNFLIGEYNFGMQYRFTDEWAVDINTGYIGNIEGTYTSTVYENIFNSGIFYYSGPFVKTSILAVVPRGTNPLRTDYNQVEIAYRMLGYDKLDFEDKTEKGKLFNISEDMQAVSLSWKAGYNLIPREVFEINAFVGFGIQMRFKNTTVNSYGYNYHSDMFVVNDNSESMQTTPLFHAGIKIGFKTINNVK